MWLLTKMEYLYRLLHKTNKGTFNDYVDTILPFFDLQMDIFNPKRGQKWHFLDYLPPLLVHVVIERPPKIRPNFWRAGKST